MALVTTCPACHTSFRVVQDQLKVAQGRVRCGRCSTVFNALEALHEQSAALTPAPTSAAPPSALEAASPRAAPMPTLREAGGSDSDTSPAPPAAAIETDQSPPPSNVMAAVEGAAPQPPWAVSPALPAAADALPITPPDTPSAAEVSGFEVTAPPAPLPTWAERQAKQSRSRGSLALAALLAVALLVQATWAWRDSLAAHWPAITPLLQGACATLACRIQPLALAQPLVVESSNLMHSPGGSVHRLELVLRNNGALPVRVPAFELSLSDLQGRLLVRRVLSAQELGAPEREEFAAGQIWRLQAPLQLGDLAVAGYTIEVFQP